MILARAAAGAELGHLFPEVAVYVEVEGDSSAELVYIETAIEEVLHISDCDLEP